MSESSASISLETKSAPLFQLRLESLAVPERGIPM